MISVIHFQWQVISIVSYRCSTTPVRLAKGGVFIGEVMEGVNISHAYKTIFI